jgi:hypothetical protein
VNVEQGTRSRNSGSMEQKFGTHYPDSLPPIFGYYKPYNLYELDELHFYSFHHTREEKAREKR